jgi:phage I-like protein
MHDLIEALFANAPLAAGTDVPAEIQWAPPGRHKITAFKNGEPTEMEIAISQATAQRLAATLQEYRSKSAAGAEDRPYLDFNHDDGEAAAHVLDFFWGGDDPIKGGVRAKVEWTEPGKQAILGRAYRRFSPSFFLDAKGELVGAPVNMGGLVNKAAFKGIQAIWSRDSSGDRQPTTKQPNKTMAEKTVEQQLAELTAAVTALTGTVNEIKAKQASPDPKIIVLETEMAGLKETTKVQAKEAAKAKVLVAVQAGKIPPQDTALIEKWENLLTIDAKNADLLDKLPVNPALQALVKSGASGTTTTTLQLTGTPAEQFVQVVKAKEAELKDKSKALDAAIAGHKDLYQAWRDANGKPGL